MTRNYKKWTYELLEEVAQRYTTRIAFQKGDRRAYDAAISRKIMDAICAHMPANRTYWTEDSLKELALSFASKSEFIKSNESAYKAAYERSILDTICSHMDAPFRWVVGDIYDAAKPYTTRKSFERGNIRAYKAAQKRGILDSVCAHMVSGTTGFDRKKPAILYYIKFELSSGIPVYKIGITNRAVKSRISAMYVNKGTVRNILKEFYFDIGQEAYDMEQSYHKEFKEHRYMGEQVMKNGNSELYCIDVLGLDKED
jgi:hypothetical protein